MAYPIGGSSGGGRNSRGGIQIADDDRYSATGDDRESRSGGETDRPDSDLGDKPIYLLEHLATFTVNKETGIVYPADGMRRLLQLEKTTGIWSQKMQLCLDNQWVLIMDYETGNIIERFPASLIQEPTAFTGNDPMEMYNNILVFIVAGGSGARSEMHIFQSQSISAVHLVEDLKQLRNGKMIVNRQTTMTTAIGHTKQGQNQEIGLSANSGGVGGHHHHHHHSQLTAGGDHESDSELGGLNDETSSTSSDKYERDVTVLNHCFDDIEKFIARLQHAAAASRELERRRRNRKSKKKDPGEGLLTLRTRPPHEKEFIDIFAKFKLSFNLLAKLKAHIHDPNAPELVHFLFTPLALIVEAASDTYYESHLPARVIHPLLTREAVNLLINCVTSKETELWRSLGDAWTIPRDQWKSGHSLTAGSYHPVFFDGWSPDYPVVDELEQPTTPTNVKRRIEHNFAVGSGRGGGVIAGGDYDYDGGEISPTYQQQQQLHQHQQPASAASAGGLHRDFSAHSDISIDSIERNGGGGMTQTGGSGGAISHQLATAAALAANMKQQQQQHHHHHHQPGNNAATSAREGGTNLHHPYNTGGIGAADPIDQTLDEWIDDLQSRSAKIVQVTYPRTANNDKELTVVRGEYLEIIDDTRKWWKARNSRGQIAHVPHTIVTPYSYNDSVLSQQQQSQQTDAFNSPLYTQQQQQQNSGGIGRFHGDSVSERYTQSGGGVGNVEREQHHLQQSSGSVLSGNAVAGQRGTEQQQQQNSADWIRNKHIGKKENIYYRDGSLYGSSETLYSDDGLNRMGTTAIKSYKKNGGAVDKTTAYYHRSSGSGSNSTYNNNNNNDSNNMTANSMNKSRFQPPNAPPPPPPPPPQVLMLASTSKTSGRYFGDGNPSESTNASTTSTTTSTPGTNNLSNNNNSGTVNALSLTANSLLTNENASSNEQTTVANAALSSPSEYHEELKHVLTLFREKRRNLDIIKTPEIYIEQSANAADVTKWLRAKGFSERVIKKLQGLNANELFALKRGTLEDYCGQEEGKRLASQITIQRNVSGYKTARTSELQAILARARQKTEQHEEEEQHNEQQLQQQQNYELTNSPEN